MNIQEHDLQASSVENYKRATSHPNRSGDLHTGKFNPQNVKKRKILPPPTEFGESFKAGGTNPNSIVINNFNVFLGQTQTREQSREGPRRVLHSRG
jgi:hypothetical protein